LPTDYRKEKDEEVELDTTILTGIKLTDFKKSPTDSHG